MTLHLYNNSNYKLSQKSCSIYDTLWEKGDLKVQFDYSMVDKISKDTIVDPWDNQSKIGIIITLSSIGTIHIVTCDQSFDLDILYDKVVGKL